MSSLFENLEQGKSERKRMKTYSRRKGNLLFFTSGFTMRPGNNPSASLFRRYLIWMFEVFAIAQIKR